MLRLLKQVTQRFNLNNFKLKCRFANPETMELDKDDSAIEIWDQEFLVE